MTTHPPLRQHETPSSPRYRHQASKNGDDPYNDLPEQESAPEKQDGAWPRSEMRYHTPAMAEPNPATPNPPNECLPNKRPPNKRPPNKCPPNECRPMNARPMNARPMNARETNARPTNTRPMNTRPTKTCHTNTTHPPKPDNPPNEHGPNGLPPNQTFQTTHPLKRVFSLCEDPPDEDIVYHTPASAVYRDAKRGHFTAQHPTQRMHRSGPGQNTGPRSHPYPLILDFPQHIRGQNKYSATHPLWRVSPLPNIQLDKCTDQVQSKTWDRTAPHTPDPRFSATMKHETNTVPHTCQSGLSYNRYCL
ncbi:hypothetical protein BS47DRAFT_1364936 [Hydnum rufescens UP504]|uniref:Uncharacterized protein n=1 Tax=Hydnum rufescens UP504 TaxID=1448309 RepID=A0A9P6APY8_9AGAM|nr:hypothetical protein BS47DRAFT_1364936 [Hydnum rufescens UP504]